MDDDFGLMPETEKKAAKQGRRAQQKPSKHGGNSQTDFDGSLIEKSQERRAKHSSSQKSKAAASVIDDDDEEEQPKRSGKLKSTWDVDPSDGRAADAYEDERLMAQKGNQSGSENESDTDIPQIPELEDTKDAEIPGSEGGVVSISPGVVTKVATYRELEDDLMKHLPFLTLDQEVDLKPLTRYLISETETNEADVPWEWETLYAEVASELMKEVETLNSLNLAQSVE